MLVLGNKLSVCRKKRLENTHPSDTKIFDGRNFIACEPVCERLEENLNVAHLGDRAGVL